MTAIHYIEAHFAVIAWTVGIIAAAIGSIFSAGGVFYSFRRLLKDMTKLQGQVQNGLKSAVDRTETKVNELVKDQEEQSKQVSQLQRAVARIEGELESRPCMLNRDCPER